MKKLIYFEWLHFSRNTARPIAILLFLLASLFGCYNGFKSYQERTNEIEAIDNRKWETIAEAEGWFDEGKTGPEGRPWVDINTPFWSMWYATHYLIQEPKSIMIFNLGQSEHFGYYKRVTMWTTAFDDDLTAEISNPELVQLGSLDFTFVWFYLMPLLLIVLTYSTKGLEQDLGFIPLLKVQIPSLHIWLLQRILTTGFGLLILLSALIFIPALLISGLSFSNGLINIWSVYGLYLVLWLALVYLIMRFSKGQADQALKMIGIWLVFTVAIPGLVNQYVLLKKPASLMMDMIEAGREGQAEIYDRPEDEILIEAQRIIPGLSKLEAAQYDSLMKQPMINGAYRLVLTEYMSKISDAIIKEQLARNQMIASSYWFNPVTGFHNWANNLTQTGHTSNLDFRRNIKKGGEALQYRLVVDEWKDKKVDKASFETYVQLLEPQKHE
ncbi:MAG: hypothetical protein AAF693_15670 [Bacteroidota bacterium]